MSESPRRWIAVITASAVVAAVPAFAPPLSPSDIRVVDDVHVALTASWSPEQQSVIDDFRRGGLAEVLRVQTTSRLQSPHQTQIVNDFFQGGVIQTEGHRFLQLFTDPQQQEFISDFLTGGVIQMVRNRLLDATTDPDARDAIIGFFPDEVTDYRGGPITMIHRRLIAAAKGNTALIGLVNAVFDNPVVLAVRHLIGGGPLIGTPLHELPPLPQDDASVRTAAVESAAETADEPASPVDSDKPKQVVADAHSTTPSSYTAESTPPADPTVDPAASDIKSGNKVVPTTLAGPDRPKASTGSWGIFGQVAESIADSLKRRSAPAATPTVGSADESGAEATDGDSAEN